MRPVKAVLVILFVCILMNMRISVEGLEVEGEGLSPVLVAKNDIKETVRGAVENQAWMKAKDRQEVLSSLGRYFEGPLLEDLTEKSWEFIALPTDWYSQAKVIDMAILYDDRERAVVEAMIEIVDFDTEQNEIGQGIFGLIKTDRGWRINYTAFYWDKNKEMR